MRRLWMNSLLAGVLMGYSTLSFGQSFDPIRFTILDETTGLTNTVINDIAQDQLGFIWIATDDGLFRYDGGTFESFRREGLGIQSLPNNLVQKIFISSDNQVWALTDYGIGIFSYETDSFQTILPGGDEGLPHKSTNSIVASNESIYVGTYGGGVARMQNGRFAQVETSSEAPYPFDQETVSVLELVDEFLFIGTWEDGMLIYDIRSRHLEQLQVGGANRVYSICRDDSGMIWFGTDTGINTYDPQKGLLSKLDHLNVDDYLSILVDGDEVWVGTRNQGLIRSSRNDLIEGTGSFQTFIPVNDANNLSHRSISVIFKDRDKNIWLGTHNGGISVFGKEANKVFHISNKESDLMHLSHASVWGIEESSDGKLFIGTDGAGIDLFDLKSHSIEPLRDLNMRLPDLAILSMKQDRLGRLWIGTYAGGIARKEIDGGITEFGGQLDSEDIRCIHESLSGKIWVGTNGGGLYFFDDQQGEFVQPEDMHSYDVRAIREGDNAILWLGTYGDGLIRFNTHTGESRKFNWYTNSAQFTPIVHSLYKSENRIWIGTRYSGLVLFDTHTESFTIYDESRGLVNNTIRAMVSDEEGQLWLSTNTGISVFDIQRENFTNFSSSSGFQTGRFNDNSGLLLSNGLIGFGGIRGLDFFNPEDLLVQQDPPEIGIKSISVLSENGKVKIPGASQMEGMELAFSQNDFEIAFAPISYPTNKGWQTESRLVGYDQDWSIPADIYLLSYRKVPPGDYTLEMRTTRGNVKGPLFSYQIQVAYPWYRMWYAYAGYLFLLGLFLWLIIRYNNSRVRLKQKLVFEQRLRQQELSEMEQKIRFFTNFSHELRSPLTLITNPQD